MNSSVNSTIVLLNTLYRIIKMHNISPDLLSLDSINRILSLAELYTKPSSDALIYFELPLENSGRPDVQFCLADSLRLPDDSDKNFSLHHKLLEYGNNTKGAIGIDFAFDADCDYVNAPCLYTYLPDYRSDLVTGFFENLEISDMGSRCLDIVSKAPKSYVPYYVGLMQTRDPSYARVGFRHLKAEKDYLHDITRYVKDLEELGYDLPISPKMQLELSEAAKFGFLKDTQLSIKQGGDFLDLLSVSSLYSQRDISYPALKLIKSKNRIDFLTDELNKCNFAMKTFTIDTCCKQIPLLISGHIQYIKCTWAGGNRKPLKAYYVISAHVL